MMMLAHMQTLSIKSMNLVYANHWTVCWTTLENLVSSQAFVQRFTLNFRKSYTDNIFEGIHISF